MNEPTPPDLSNSMVEPQSSQLQRLLNAVMSLGSELSLPVVLERIVEAATQLVGATYGALGVLDEDRNGLSEFITVGVDPVTTAGIGAPPQGHGILGLLIVDPEPLRLPDIASHPDSFGMPPGHPSMTSFLGVPIHVRGEVFGNLYLTDKRGATEFSDNDEELAIALASVAGVAIENARLHGRLADLALLEDRERIARNLHDTVIQRLFATGLVLQGLAGRVDDPTLADRLARAVDDLDDTVRHIRTTIFELQRPAPEEVSVRRSLLRLADDAAGQLGFRVTVRFDGPVDTLVDAPLGEQLLAVVTEALSNVVRHAGASQVDVDLVVDNGMLSLTVVDDGTGIALRATSTTSGGNGLVNLRSRAEKLGGSFSISSEPGQGCRLAWTAPLDG